MKVLFVGGGTGGHLYPNIAVAEKLKRVRPDAEILFLGQKGRMEEKILPVHGFPLRFIDSSTIVKRPSIQLPRQLAANAKGIFQARRVMKEFQPEVVFGTGGYESFPPFVAAWSLGIPILLQEQNVLPGFTNRHLARFARVFALSFEASKQYSPAEAIR